MNSIISGCDKIMILRIKGQSYGKDLLLNACGALVIAIWKENRDGKNINMGDRHNCHRGI